jgi:hypothetical protein
MSRNNGTRLLHAEVYVKTLGNVTFGRPSAGIILTRSEVDLSEVPTHMGSGNPGQMLRRRLRNVSMFRPVASCKTAYAVLTSCILAS